MMSAGGILSSKVCIAQRLPVCSPSRAYSSRVESRQLIIASAKPVKAAGMRTEFTSDAAIATEVDRLRGEMFGMRIKFAKREDYNPAEYAALKKTVAKLLTIKREREIEQGVDKRDSRAAEKQKLVEAGLGQF